MYAPREPTRSFSPKPRGHKLDAQPKVRFGSKADQLDLYNN